MIVKSEHDAVQVLSVEMEKIKRAVGPCFGLIDKYYPKASTLRATLVKIYDEAKWLQDEFAKL